MLSLLQVAWKLESGKALFNANLQSQVKGPL